MAIHALTFVFGVWLLQQMACLPGVWGMIGLSFVAIITILCFRKFPVAILFSISLLGFCWAGFCAHLRLADALPLEWEGRVIEVEGVAASLPQQMENGIRFEFEVERVLTPGASVPRHISLSQYSSRFNSSENHPQENQAINDLLPIRAGERWQLDVKLKRPHSLANPGGFDFEAWALERNIRATGTVQRAGTNRCLSSLVWSSAYLVERIRQMIQNHMQEVLRGKAYSGILQALVIGNESAISQDDWQLFLRTGTNHLMSISGLHITMFSGLFFGLTMFFWRRMPEMVLLLPARKAAVLAGLVSAFFYALIAGFSVPTQRTFYMLAVFALALWSGRRVSMVNVLAYAAFVVVFLDPWAVLAPGFWLSFCAVAFMAFALSGRLGRVSWWTSTVRSQWVVTLALIPFLLIFFQQFSVVSPFANAFAIPVVSLLVVPLAILGAIFSVDQALLGAHFLMQVVMQGLTHFSQLSWAVWPQSLPPVWTFLIALLGILWLFSPRAFPLRFLGLMLCVPMFLLPPAKPAQSEVRMAILDVGQGLAAVIQTKSHTLLYDTGGKTSSQNDSGQRVILPYLRVVGINHLDGMIVSHDDLDHSGGMNSVLKNLAVDWLLSSLPRSVDGVKNLKCFSGQSWLWDGVRFDVISPLKDSYQIDIKDNNRSCVLRVSSTNGSVVFAGDIEREAEHMLVLGGAHLQSDVLVVPHHGSKTSSTESFIDAVNPSAAIFTMGYRNRFGHPKPEVEARYISRGIKTYRSDEDGAILINFDDPQKIDVKTWRSYAKRYWQS